MGNSATATAGAALRAQLNAHTLQLCVLIGSAWVYNPPMSFSAPTRPPQRPSIFLSIYDSVSLSALTFHCGCECRSAALVKYWSQVYVQERRVSGENKHSSPVRGRKGRLALYVHSTEQALDSIFHYYKITEPESSIFYKCLST